jgi:prepilin-type N-terminal cleavage/methylation domain-containing protein
MKAGIVLKIFKKQDGFTFIEIISVLVVLGILVAVVVSRLTNYDAEALMGADVLKEHLRYAQTRAMNEGSIAVTETVMGIHYDSGANKYWLFRGTDPNSNINSLPDDPKYVTSNKIDLAAKKIKFGSDFTLYFDNHGIPYTTYTDSTSTSMSTALTINVTALSGSSSSSVTITPYTGFIP